MLLANVDTLADWARDNGEEDAYKILFGLREAMANFSEDQLALYVAAYQIEQIQKEQKAK